MITVNDKDRIFIDNKESKFFLHEFVAPEIWDKWHHQSLRYIQEPVIIAAQFLRVKSGQPITICNYVGGGSYRDSGTRTKESYLRMLYSGYIKKGHSEKAAERKCLQAYLKTYSMHKFCGAGDLKIGKMSSVEMAALVFKYESELMEIGIRRIEDPAFTKGYNRDWLHIDTGNQGLKKILIVKPY